MSILVDKDGKPIENPKLENRPKKCSCDPFKEKHSTHRDSGGFLICSNCGGRIYWTISPQIFWGFISNQNGCV